MVVKEVVKGSYSLLKTFLLILLREFEVGPSLERPDAIRLTICVDVPTGHLVVEFFCLVCRLKLTGTSSVDKLEILCQPQAQVLFNFALYLVSLSFS